MRVKQITQKSGLSAKRSASLHHGSIRYHQPPIFFFFKLCYVSRYVKNTFQQILDTANLRSDLKFNIGDK